MASLRTRNVDGKVYYYVRINTTTRPGKYATREIYAGTILEQAEKLKDAIEAKTQARRPNQPPARSPAPSAAPRRTTLGTIDEFLTFVKGALRVFEWVVYEPLCLET